MKVQIPINEARIKGDPYIQIDEYIDRLDSKKIDALNLRCAELIDKWGIAPLAKVDSVPWDETRKFMGDERFLKFLKKTVPLTEPKPRDMGANTFVSHFFDSPFDIEEFIGKMAKEKGIPFT